MLILGLTHPVSWNTAAVLLEDNKVIAAGEEERFVRIKHAPRMIPFHAIESVLAFANVKHDDVETIAISWDGAHEDSEINEALKKVRAP